MIGRFISWNYIVFLSFIFSFTSETVAADTSKAQLALANFKSERNTGWAYKRVKLPRISDVQDGSWPIQELDYFVLGKIEGAGLKPSKDAPRNIFIRRAALDTWGLAPTPEEVEDFENDNSPDAYEKLVDRLLASPRFGERQARHWLDLARYADSAGFESDDDRLNMWRYRDYVIDAFNEDKPFNQFILEQIAGDEIWPEDYKAKIATDFLAGYPDSGGFRDLIKRKFEIEIDMVKVVGETFLAASIGCAQCHDHKFDKISQKDFYKFQAFFANTAAFEQVPVEKGFETPSDLAYLEQQRIYDESTAEIRAKQKAILDMVREDGHLWRRARYFSDARDSIYKPVDQWTPLDRWVNHRAGFIEVEGQIMRYLRASADPEDSAYNPDNIEMWNEYQGLSEQLKKFDNLKPRRGSPYYTTIKDLGEDSPETHIRFGGIYERPLETVEPALPDLWAGSYEPEIIAHDGTTGRRTALANWIASEENPLTARVYVNRVWAQYFAKGIAANPGEFGKAGSMPTNPELLDHLAYEFMAKNWSVKTLIKTILLSHTYRQASDERKDVLLKDPKNDLLSVYPRKRLDAEQVRDSLLYVSGELDEDMGGPAVFPKIPEDMSKGNKFWDANADENENYRRSIYTFVRRSLPYALTASFDPADANSIHHKREVSTTALQALALINSDEVFELSQSLAGNIIEDVGFDGDAKIDRLYEILFSRGPDKKEKKLVKTFLKNQKGVVESKAWSDTFSIAVPVGIKSTEGIQPIEAAAFLDLVHALMCSNDFIYRY